MIKRKLINPEAFENAIKEVKAGRLGYIGSENFEIPFAETTPIDGYEIPDNFPYCCDFHKKIFAYANEQFDSFPNCCDAHKKLLHVDWFNKNNYKAVPLKTIHTLSHTEHHISTQIDKEDWYNDITNYVEYCIRSFGQFPAGYGCTLGLELYTRNIKNWIEGSKNIDEEKKLSLIEYISGYDKIDPKVELPNINILIDTYKKWLKVFPFGISYFNDLKQHFEKQIPIFDGVPEYNPYLGTSKAKTITPLKLISILTDRTKQLLRSIVTSQLVNDGIITDIHKHTIELLNESHRVRQSSLLVNFTNGEMQYVRVLKKWLSNEKDYFKEFTKIKDGLSPSSNDNEGTETKREKLKSALNKFGFYDLPMVNVIPKENKEKLLTLILDNKLPYKIAMINYVGFISHLEREHFHNAKYKMNKEISKLFNSDREGRTIKGHISSLLPNTTEDKKRYTAYRYKETVKKDYSKLK